MGKAIRGWLAGGLALMFFVGLAALPFALQGSATPPWVQSAQRISPVSLLPETAPLPAVALSDVATPMRPMDAPATPPTVDAARMAALVAAEDLRLRTLLHHASKIPYPEVVPVTPDLGGTFDPTTGAIRGTPTVVLPGPANYTIGDLLALGAVVPLTQGGGYLLTDNVLVGSGATLKLGGADVHTLLMDSSATGFTSIVTWGGTLTLSGDNAGAPFTITGWDRTTNKPAADAGTGRPYIRAVGGRMDLIFVHVSALGFWSGRTGGVAWTGTSSKPSTGSAASSQFLGNTYGAFVSRSDKVIFKDDLFEGNELDGLRLHRHAVNSSVTASAAARNGGNGFVVSRGAAFNVLRGDLSINNRLNGFLVNGQSLVTGASPSGGDTVASAGISIQDSDSEANARTGILVEGGAGTIIRNNIVCGPITGIAIRAGATLATVVGNDVRCGGRIAMSIGPAVVGTTVSGNTLESARIGLLIRNSSGVRIMYNRITGMTLFGISVRGLSPGVVGNGNVIAGHGFQPIDARSSASAPDITASDTSGWQHQTQLSLVSELRYHPLLTTWLVVLMLVVISSIAIRLRHRPDRPYPYTVPWRPAAQVANPLRVGPLPTTVQVPTAAPAPAYAAVRRQPEAAVVREPRVRQSPPSPVPASALWQPFANVSVEATAPAAPASTKPDTSTAQPIAARPRKRRPTKTLTDTAPAMAATSRPVEPQTKPERASPSSPPDKPAADPFWDLLASGTWTANQANLKSADQEAPA